MLRSRTATRIYIYIGCLPLSVCASLPPPAPTDAQCLPASLLVWSPLPPPPPPPTILSLSLSLFKQSLFTFIVHGNMEKQNHCMSIKESKLIANAHKHNKLNSLSFSLPLSSKSSGGRVGRGVSCEIYQLQQPGANYFRCII